MDFKKLAGQASSFLDKKKEPAPAAAPTQTAPPPAGGSAPVTNTAAPAQPAAGGQDYGDKAFDMLAKKSGKTVDKDTSEKITDGARGLFEKFTGKKVDPKYSS